VPALRPLGIVGGEGRVDAEPWEEAVAGLVACPHVQSRPRMSEREMKIRVEADM
jgi:hypothetical protein